MKTTFHRAIDMTMDVVAAVDAVVECGCDKILTSGGEATAIKGAGNIRAMLAAARGRIDVIAAAGISETNVVEVLQVRKSTKHTVSVSMTYPYLSNVVRPVVICATKCMVLSAVSYLAA